MEGEDADFLSDILNVEGAHVAGLDEMQIPNTQDSTRVEEVQGSRSGTKGGRRSKNFRWKEDEVVCLGWLAVSKDPLNGAYQSRTTFWGRVHAYYEEKNESRYKGRKEVRWDKEGTNLMCMIAYIYYFFYVFG